MCKKVRDQQSESLREVPKGKENQAGTKDLTVDSWMLEVSWLSTVSHLQFWELR